MPSRPPQALGAGWFPCLGLGDRTCMRRSFLAQDRDVHSDAEKDGVWRHRGRCVRTPHAISKRGTSGEAPARYPSTRMVLV
jgi:hypothetical protein